MTHMTDHLQPLGHGLYWEELPLGFTFTTFGRTITESDLMSFVSVTGFNATIDVKAPVFVNDTIHVEGEVTEAKPTSKGSNGIVRTLNKVLNQRGELVLTYNPLRMMKGRVASPVAK